MFSASKCVLFLNDEGVSIYNAGASQVAFIDSVPWETQDFEEAVAEIISGRCGNRPVLLFNDMVEQHYRKERVPKASTFDRASILQRRLAAAFPTYPVKSAIKLKEKPSAKEGEAQSGEVYLLAAVPLSENLNRVFESISRTEAALKGFALLPVESSSMVHELSKKVGNKNAAWTIFVGQHRSGGLRQIVTKNGELALTRMTAVASGTSDVDLWTGDVVGELRGTMGYLARFGFDRRDGLNVIVVAPEDATESIGEKIDFECDLRVLTVTEAAETLKLGLGRQDSQNYADVLHIAWLQKKPSLAMPLKSSVLTKLGAPTKMANAASVVLLIAAGYASYLAYAEMSAWHKNSEQIVRETAQLETLRADHAAEVQKKKDVGVDFLLIETAGKYYEGIDGKTMRPLPTIDLIGRALGPDLHLSNLEITGLSDDEIAIAEPEPEPEIAVTDADGNPVGNEPKTQRPPENYKIVLGFSFPATLPIESGVRQMEDLKQRISLNLPTHKVSIVKQVADLSYTGNFVSGEQIEQNQGQQQNYEAQILVEGPLR